MQAHKYPKKTGSDWILRKEDRLIICSKTNMKDWQIGSLRKMILSIDGELWQLTEKRQLAGKEFRYYLDPWEDSHKEIPGHIILYDKAYVEARDEAEKKRRKSAPLGFLLHIIPPLIGFLPSSIKAGIEAKFGISARSSTLGSIIIELVIFFIMGAFLQIFVYASMRAPQLVVFVPFFITVVPILLLDLIMRYHSYLREDTNPWGFYEWLLRRRKKH
jgi:hypothetical protein